MIDGKTVVGVIVARGGSKRLPGKNLMPLNGKPLIAWSVEAAQNAQCLDQFILSSDDTEIMTAARAAGCPTPFQR
ncbi:MAG TPA: NTP transferase domain-containing protein, partial [Magnetovibrio sp.]